MRKIDLIVIHCSATREDRCFTEFDLDVCHRRRGFNGPGYHFYIRKDGRIVSTRPVEKIGAHAKGHNATSIGICYEGGLDARGRPKDTRTEWQVHSMRVLVMEHGRLLSSIREQVLPDEKEPSPSSSTRTHPFRSLPTAKRPLILKISLNEASGSISSPFSGGGKAG